MIIKNVKKYFFTYVVPTFYGGGSGGGQNTTVQQRNIPKELAPYYEMLFNSMAKQTFTSADNPAKPAPKVAADWTPNTMSYAKGGEVKRFGDGGAALLDTLTKTGAASTTNGVFSPTGIVPYQPSQFVTTNGNYDPNKTVAQPTGLQNMSYSAAANMGLPEQNQAASELSAIAGQGGLNTASTALDYGGAGYQAGLNSAQLGNAGADTAAQNANLLGNSAQNYGGLGAISGMQGQALGVLGGGAYGEQASGFGNAAANTGANYTNAVTDASNVGKYMNPYLNQSLKPQLDLARQEADITTQQNNSKAAQAGAYGGSRQAVQKALTDQGLALNQANIVGQGYKNAYDTAQQNIGKASDLTLQGLQTGIQGSQAGLQGVNAQLAGTAQGMQGAGVGLSGVNAATGAGQYGLSGVGAGIEGQKTAMQGAQTGLSGVGAAQQGYGMAGNAGQQLMGIGNQQLAQQQSIAGLQNQYGAQQQALNQQAINNAITYNDYQQNYPWERLGGFVNALNGVQVGNMSQYAPSPSLISQVGGLGATALGAYGANGGFKAKKGGKVPKAQGSGIGDLAVYNAMKGGK